MYCPICGSEVVVEVDNLHSRWACNTCGYQDDADAFDPGEPLYYEVQRDAHRWDFTPVGADI